MVCRAANLLLKTFAAPASCRALSCAASVWAFSADARVTNRATARLTPVLM